MTFAQAIASGFAKYATFSGRAVRSEFWWWALFSFLMCSAASVLDYAFFPKLMSLGVDTGPLNGLVSLGLLLPNFAVTARRLHDLDKTGWWILIIFTIIGAFVLLAWCCMRGTEGANRFGPEPVTGPAY